MNLPPVPTSCSDTDFASLHGNADRAANANSRLAARADLFVVTRGSQGAIACHAQPGDVAADARPVIVVDTIGAGDRLQAGLLFALKTIDRIARSLLAHTGADALTRVLR